MSNTIGASSYGTLDRMLASASSLRDQYATLQQQTTSGLVSQSYAGLAAVSSQVLDLTAASSQNTAYTQSIANAQGKASVMQNALSQLSSMVSTMASSALGLSGSSDSSAVTSMAQQASQALAQMVSVLNTTYGGDYVFAGADTSNPPVPSPGSVSSSGMYTQIGSAMSALATIPSTTPVATVIAATVATAASTAAGTTIFSPYLAGTGSTASPVTVQIGPSNSVTLDLPANRNVGAVSDPSINGTGNAISDIMRSLAVMANSTTAMAGNPDFLTLMQNASTTLTSAGATLAQESGQIGQTQSAMTAATASHASMQILLTSQLSNLTNVDMATAISHLQTVNAQLQASYKVLGEVSSLNLASFL
jgi:flagellar hook-associated protein 3 FlgL